MTARCDCCDLAADSCGRAAERRQRADELNRNAELLARPGWFPARYFGRCVRCGEHFEAGTPIRRARDGGPGYVADCCEDR